MSSYELSFRNHSLTYVLSLLENTGGPMGSINLVNRRHWINKKDTNIFRGFTSAELSSFVSNIGTSSLRREYNLGPKTYKMVVGMVISSYN